MNDPFDRLESLAAKLVSAGWEQIWQVSDTWWMAGFQRKRAMIIVAVIGDRVRVFSPTNQKFQLEKPKTPFDVCSVSGVCSEDLKIVKVFSSVVSVNAVK